MIVPEQIRKCVAFVGFQIADKSFRLVGSGFFLGREEEGGKATSARFVTARHVIDGIRAQALTEVHLRMNRTHGDAVWLRREGGGVRSLDSGFSSAPLPAPLPTPFPLQPVSQTDRPPN